MSVSIKSASIFAGNISSEFIKSGKIEGMRSTGRPRKTWIYGLKAGMSRRSRTLGEVERARLYDDGNEWRVFWKSSS